MPGDTRQRRTWGLLLLVAGGLVVLLFLPPLLPPAWRMGIMAFFAPACHQIPERSFAIHGIPLAVCHRCTGIYAGVWAGILLYPLLIRFWRRSVRMLLVLGVLPALIDWSLTLTGLWMNTPLSRVLTGSVAGLTVGLVLTFSLLHPPEASPIPSPTLHAHE